MRDRQYLGALRVREGVITLEQLHFADEIRPVDEVKPERARVESEELEMAQQLIECFSGNWKPEKYKDTYRDALCAVIEAKRKGKEVHVAAEPEEDEPADLMEALRAEHRVGRAAARRRPRRSRSRVATDRGANGSSRSCSKSELEQRARKAQASKGARRCRRTS